MISLKTNMIKSSPTNDRNYDENALIKTRPSTSYVLIRPNTTQSGSGHAYLSARKCKSQNKNRTVTHFQHSSTLCYKLTLSKNSSDDSASNTDDFSMIKENKIPNSLGRINCDPVTIKRERKQENSTDSNYISKEYKDAFASEAVSLISDNENIDDIDETIKRAKAVQKSKALFKRRYVLSAGENRNKVEELILKNPNSSKTQIKPFKNSFENENFSLKNLLSEKTWQYLESNEQNKIYQSLQLLSKKTDSKNKKYNSINFFYSVRQKTDLSVENDSVFDTESSSFPLRLLNDKSTNTCEENEVNKKDFNVQKQKEIVNKKSHCCNSQYTETNDNKVLKVKNLDTTDFVKSSYDVVKNDDSLAQVKNPEQFRQLSSQKSRRSSLSSSKTRSSTPCKKNKG